MNTVSDFGIQHIYHIAPIHYLAFIARSGRLKSKTELVRSGFEAQHFRSKSKKQDVERGFENYAHLTTSEFPPILEAKLRAGFPHIALKIASRSLDNVDFDLCRYNVAMTRKLRRGNQFGHNEGPTNGYYFDGIQIPIARTYEDQYSLLTQNISRGNMIEILVPDALELAQPSEVITFNEHDAYLVQSILAKLECDWLTECRQAELYNPHPEYVASCISYLKRATNDPEWHGDGLEFDKV